MEFKYLKTRRENATLWVELKNPPVNFLTMDILEELFVLVKTTSKDDSIRVLVLTGTQGRYLHHALFDTGAAAALDP